MKLRRYLAWDIYQNSDHWEAWRFGVRLRSRTYEQLLQNIKRKWESTQFPRKDYMA